MTLAPRLEIQPPVQRQLWPSLRGLTAAGFVFYGGTAIALRCGHRVSVDFDFFTARPLERGALQRLLPWLESSTVLQNQPDTFTVLSAGDAGRQGGVKVSFFGGLTIGRVAEPEPSSDGVAVLASPIDLLATKLKGLLQRAKREGCDDVAVLLASGLTLTEGLGVARALHEGAINPPTALGAPTGTVE
ncbi:MAG: nucleotidyl transferase AbiEii/AbiGii toxin family protein [Cyanobium sp. ELA507]